MRRLLAVAALLAFAACNDGATVAGGGDRKPQLRVSAASSLEEALTACAPGYAGAAVQLRFAGSDELAAQLRRGVPADVFAAAGTALPEALAQEGKLEAPVEFASLDPTATYAAGVVTAAAQPEAAQAFVDDLLAGGCHDALLAAGFGEP